MDKAEFTSYLCLSQLFTLLRASDTSPAGYLRASDTSSPRLILSIYPPARPPPPPSRRSLSSARLIPPRLCAPATFSAGCLRASDTSPAGAGYLRGIPLRVCYLPRDTSARLLPPDYPLALVLAFGFLPGFSSSGSSSGASSQPVPPSGSLLPRGSPFPPFLFNPNVLSIATPPFPVILFMRHRSSGLL